MSALTFLFCLMISMILIVVVLLRVTSSGKKQDLQTPRSAQGWKSWIPYFAMALIIARWTIPGDLFFLAVVWVLRLDPKSYTKGISVPSDSEKKTAKILYAWLMLSSFLTVPIFVVSLFNLSSNASANEQVLAALIPLIFQTPLLFGLSSKSAFVFRHTQQAILLVSIRAGLAALIISSTSDPWIWIILFLLGNGTIWLFGSLWGWDQIKRGKCWLMERKGQTFVSVESAKTGLPKIDQEPEGLPKSSDVKDRFTTKHKALQSFRTGNPEVKKRAVEVLSKLGEIEQF